MSEIVKHEEIFAVYGRVRAAIDLFYRIMGACDNAGGRVWYDGKEYIIVGFRFDEYFSPTLYLRRSASPKSSSFPIDPEDSHLFFEPPPGPTLRVTEDIMDDLEKLERSLLVTSTSSSGLSEAQSILSRLIAKLRG